MLSVVIPTLDAAETLAAVLDAVADDLIVGEVIVADGGSADASREIAEARGARVVSAPPGRGIQLAAGATAAAGDWLLFLHADTVPGPGWQGAVAAATADWRETVSVFRFALDDARPAARRLERLVHWRTRVLGLPFGDQGLLISRPLYDAVGGYRPLPLFEDVDLVRRLGRKRIRQLDAAAVTSARRYAREGYAARSLRNFACLALYYLGVPARLIEGLYG